MAWADLLFAALASSAFVAALGTVAFFLLRPAYENWLRHKFDRALESLKAAGRQEDEKLKAELVAQQRQIETLQSGALSAMAARVRALDERRLKALETVWAAACELAPFVTASEISKTIKMDVMLEASSRNDADGIKAKEFVGLISNSFRLADIKLENKPIGSRIFLPPLVWALFSAYQQ